MTFLNKILAPIFCLVAFVAFGQKEAQKITIGESITLESNILNETRTINIYLPPYYQPNVTIKYPVVYILDGGVEEDFIHLTGIFRVNSQPWINRFPEAIVVGIENVNRRRDFTFAVPNIDFLDKVGYSKEFFPQYGGAEPYAAFLESELMPYIDQHYNTNEERTVVGESLAGLMSSYLLIKHPHLFTNYIIVSPSFWWGEEKLLDETTVCLLNKIKHPVNVYVGVPSKEEDAMMFEVAERFYSYLQKNPVIHSTFDYMPDEVHATVLHQATHNALKKQFYKK
ncbi:alpha/beta hydrolase [Myroides odoratus]|uniref:Ferri-bacillibactin esterase BesA n=1 Tax=Myroides odoratus TaxID=256 RepID=A0A378U1J3_MYROD|nr:alpha/beta hydrolase-fold protein [Myroides odoratus]QQU03630.1 alpha/beta hydrolase [Myroides odoratus]STZ69098.1 Ferri-bacillibactin esterase BesA [Myroides odoratus]